jgi:hypothetical protein
MMRGEVLARWQEFVGTGDIFRSLDATVNGLRDRLSIGVRGQAALTQQLEEAVQTGVQALIRSAVQRAADEAVTRWRARPEGTALLDSTGGVSVIEQRVSPGFDDRLARSVREWQAVVVDSVQQESAARRGGPLAMPLGLNAAGLIVMLTVFNRAAGLVDGEEGVAAGTAAVAGRLLEAVFGDQAVRALTTRARADLVARANGVLDAERSRIEGLLDDAEVRDGRGEMLRALTGAVEEAR